MKFIDLKPLYNEVFASSLEAQEEDLGINGVWFLQEHIAFLGVEGIGPDGFYPDGQRLTRKASIIAEKIFFYCFSENQIQNLHITINQNMTYTLRVPDWSEIYIPKEIQECVKVQRSLPANIGRKLTIYETALQLPEKTLIEEIHFRFNPCIHIWAVGYI